MIRIALFLTFLAALAFLVWACTPPVTTPIGTVDFRQPGEERRQTLLVFLPGLHDSVEVFADKGFIAALNASGIRADMVGVEAHLGYYLKKELLTRLRNDVVIPAQREGYERIWLVGVSLGGFGAIWYDMENPGDLAGVVALSPYLGEEEVVREVARSGGLREWQPSGDIGNDDQRKIWQRLKGYEKAEKHLERVFLAYGKKDRFAGADDMLAAVLPPAQVFTADGGHDWPTWNLLWERMLRVLPMERRQTGAERERLLLASEVDDE